MYNRLPRAVLPRGILLRHIFLGEPAFSNHNGAKGRNLSQGPLREAWVRASPYTPGNHPCSGIISWGRPGPTMRDRLVLQILSVQVDVPLLMVNFPVVTRFFLSRMTISPLQFLRTSLKRQRIYQLAARRFRRGIDPLRPGTIKVCSRYF